GVLDERDLFGSSVDKLSGKFADALGVAIETRAEPGRLAGLVNVRAHRIRGRLAYRRNPGVILEIVMPRDRELLANRVNVHVAPTSARRCRSIIACLIPHRSSAFARVARADIFAAPDLQ